MSARIAVIGGMLALWMLAPGCGDNVAPNSNLTLQPPTGLLAFSAGVDKVSLRWTPAKGWDNAQFAGYRISWGSTFDTVGANVVYYLADSLPPGPTTFSISSRSKTGGVSDPATMTWAPATRFDSTYTLNEYNAANANLNGGLHVGSRLTNPFGITVGDAQAPTTMDVYLAADASLQLHLRSASLFVGTWKVTSFSTQVDSGSSLDTFLPAFPPASSFTQADLPVYNNMICYARVAGEVGETNYLRLCIQIVPNLSAPNRAVHLSISLQRTSGVLYAFTGLTPVSKT